MKKLILTGAALIAFAAAAQAQIFQNGIQQFAQQIQSGTNQTGVINQLKGDGTNYGNYAITFQGTSSNTGMNTANINQNGGPNADGTGGGPNSGSQGNRGAITQNGGPNNLATINQNGGPDGLSGGGTSVSATLSAPGEDGNFAGILQQGSNNTAQIDENNNSRRNAAEVYQNGNRLTGTILQSNGSVNNKASVNQGFVNNVAGTPITNSQATIRQGKINAADMSASGSSISESIGNTANITQSVSNVNAIISQGSTPVNGGNPGRAEGSTAGITQNAVNTGFQAGINQGTNSGESIGSRATLTITGENNTQGFISQGFGAGGLDNGSTAAITMAGTTSFAIIQQAERGQTDGDAATITQSSAVQGSFATIQQGFAFGGFSGILFSRNDKATINQTGLNNNSTIFQNSVMSNTGQANGSDNIATVMQTNGVSNVTGNINQGVSSGTGTAQAVRNQATINQTSGTNQTAYIGQGTDDAGGATLTTLSGPAATLGLIANDNMATITQSGGNNMQARLLQSGRNNLGTITQSAGSNSTAQIVQTSNSRFGRAVITQSSSGNGNMAQAFQFAGTNADGRGAFGNEIEINQVGTGSNNIAIAQQGVQGATSSSNDNFIRFVQNGSNNQARMLQTGNNNFVDVTQTSNDNRLEGTGGMGTFASQQGYNNRLTLVQNSNGGTGKVFTYTQIGNNNTQNVVQQNP